VTADRKTKLLYQYHAYALFGKQMHQKRHHAVIKVESTTEFPQLR